MILIIISLAISRIGTTGEGACEFSRGRRRFHVRLHRRPHSQCFRRLSQILHGQRADSALQLEPRECRANSNSDAVSTYLTRPPRRRSKSSGTTNCASSFLQRGAPTQQLPQVLSPNAPILIAWKPAGEKQTQTLSSRSQFVVAFSQITTTQWDQTNCWI